ncbi:MAG TPA: ABC transporter permease, partial [Gemmatirosa sp.]
FVGARLPASTRPVHAGEVGAAPQRGSVAARAARTVRLSGVLSQRYVDVIRGDRRTLALALGQSVVIGGALRILFGAGALSPAHELQLGFLLAVSAFWFGCNNAVKEVVKERGLLLQEWAAGITLPAYMTSKVVVLAALAVLQSLLLLLIVVATGVQLHDARASVGQALLGAMAGTALGLLVSCAADSTDGAATTLPILLIPQLLFSEAVVSPLSNAARPIAKAGIAAYWLNQSVHAEHGDPAVDAGLPPIVLTVQIVVCLAASAVLLGRSLRRR